MGRIYTHWKGMSDLARTEFDAVLKKDPKFFPAIIGLGDIAFHRQRFYAEFFQFGARRLAHFHFARAQHDVRACFGKPARHLQTDAGGAASDDADMAFKV